MLDAVKKESAKRIRKLPAPNLAEAGLIPTIRKPLGIKPEAFFFSESRVSALIIDYRKTGELETWHKIILETMNLIDALILDGRFDRYDCLDALRSECVIKLTYTIGKWNPDRGKCFSLFSHSIKNFLFSYADRARKYSSFLSSTDNELLEESPDNKAAPISLNFRERMENIEVRFWQPGHLQALSFLVQNFFEYGEDESKKVVLMALVKRFGLSSVQAELLYCYALIKVRSALYEFYGHEFSDAEVLRTELQWTLLPDLCDVVGAESFNRVLTVFAGQTITFPNAMEIRRIRGIKTWIVSRHDVSEPAIQKTPGYDSDTLQRHLQASLNGCGQDRKLP